MTQYRRNSIEVVSYDLSWPVLFEEIRLRIESVLSGLIAEIHHIGSTSVPGLCAKPKIDIDIILRCLSDIPEGVARMQASGDYTFHGDIYSDEMWVFTTGRGSYGQRLYLFAPDHPTHQQRILFRDYLRRHPEAAATYAALKRKLACEAVDDWDHYTALNQHFCHQGPFRSR